MENGTEKFKIVSTVRLKIRQVFLFKIYDSGRYIDEVKSQLAIEKWLMGVLKSMDFPNFGYILHKTDNFS